MKQLLRLFAVVGVVLLAALISAGSCDDDPNANKNTNTNTNDDGNKNINTNTNTNSGGGDGGDTTTTISPLKITPVATVAKMKDGTIYLNAAKFPAAAAGAADKGLDEIVVAAAATKAKAFEIEYDKATAGIIIVGHGDLLNATKFTTPAPAAPATADRDGVRVIITPAALGTGAGSIPVGTSIISIFAKDEAGTTANKAVDKAPFAFSKAADIQPVLYCIATIPALKATADFTATSKLTGGQKSTCYVASLGAKALGTTTAADRAAWFTAVNTAANNQKRETQVAISAINTADKGIAALGQPGANDVAKIGAFADGLNATEMAAVVAANKDNVQFKKYKIKIVTDADFTALK